MLSIKQQLVMMKLKLRINHFLAGRLIVKYKGKKMPIIDLATSIAHGIELQEGYGTARAVTITANNNPGAIRNWPGYPTVGGYAKFPDYETGFNAIVTNTITNINKPNFSLADYITRYEGGTANVDKNNIPAYIASVAQSTNLPTDVPLSQLVDRGGIVDASIDGGSGGSGGNEAAMIDPTMLGYLAVGAVVVILISKL